MADERLKIRPKLKGEDGHKTFSIRVENEVVDEIEIISKKTGRSRNELIGMMLKYVLKMYDIEEEVISKEEN